MVVRDIDVLQAVSRQARCSVYLSVPSVDEEAWRRLEPGTAHPLQRLKAVRKLADAGLAANVLMAPLLPGITTSRSAITATIRAIADHGANAVGANVVRLDAGTREHFLRVLAPSTRIYRTATSGCSPTADGRCQGLRAGGPADGEGGDGDGRAEEGRESATGR